MDNASNSELPSSTTKKYIGCKQLYNSCLGANGYGMLIDCRNENDFKQAHIPGSINIPSPPSPLYRKQFDLSQIFASEPSNTRSPKSFKFRRGKIIVLYADEGNPDLVDFRDGESNGSWRCLQYVPTSDPRPWIEVLADLLVEDAQAAAVNILRGESFEDFKLQHYPWVMTINELPRCRFPNDIVPGFLYLGNYQQALQDDIMKEMGITHIINAAYGVESCVDALAGSHGITYLNVYAEDHENQDLLPYFDEVADFLEAALLQREMNANPERPDRIVMKRLSAMQMRSLKLINTMGNDVAPDSSSSLSNEEALEALSAQAAIGCSSTSAGGSGGGTEGGGGAGGGGVRVFVHCFAGVSRSSSLVIAYLMFKLQWPLARAYQHVFACRPQICPNMGFRKQLLQHEVKLFGKASIQEEDLSKLGNIFAGLGESTCEPSREKEVNSQSAGCTVM